MSIDHELQEMIQFKMHLRDS